MKIPAVVLLSVTAAFAQPAGICPSNPHYFQFKGKPLVLITSDHHYGAVIDREFDFVVFLDYLAQSGMNLTRIYPGGMFEPKDKYVAGNPLGPRPGRHILPWAMSNETGANPALYEPGQPSYKFDLDRWNPEYFARLKSFVELARKKGIIVEVAFFNGMYADCWPLMAMYHQNNIQNVGRYEAEDCGLFTTNDPRNQDVLRYQKAYVAKIAAELNDYDNLIFDLCDEPSLQGRPDGSITNLPDSQVGPWLLELKDAFRKAEAALPKKHLLGQTVQNLSPDFSRESWCDWLPAEYVRPAAAALERDYEANKPIVDVETDYFGHGLVKPYTTEDVRLEGWWFMLRGGAGFINLNGEYYRGHEAGGKDTRTVIVPQKKILKEFLESFEFSRMERFADLADVPAGAVASALAEKGRQYGVYLFHAREEEKWGAHFTATPGTYRDKLVLKAVPPAQYGLEWVDPATGKIIGRDKVDWGGGDLTLTTPSYKVDIALRMLRR